MQQRITKQVKNNPAKAWRTFDLMMRRSRVFTLWVLRKSDPHAAYKNSGSKLSYYISQYVRKIRLKEHVLDVRRTYIKKPNGKMRPIGSPSLDSKMVMVAVTEFLKIHLEPRISKNQHGFLTGRGGYTAIKELNKKIQQGGKFIEFDLKSFFNNVNYGLVCESIEKQYKGLGK